VELASYLTYLDNLTKKIFKEYGKKQGKCSIYV